MKRILSGAASLTRGVVIGAVLGGVAWWTFTASAQFTGPEDRLAPHLFYRSPRVETGAIPRPLNDKLGDIVSAKDYGVKCDDKTDDTAAIILAIKNAANKTLLFPPGGACRVTPGQITIGDTLANVPARIIGYSTVFYPFSSVASPLLTIDNLSTTFSLQGLGFHCDTGKAAYGIKIHGSMNASYRDIAILGGCSSGGLWLSGEPSFGIYRNLFEHIVINGHTGPGIIAKSINNSGQYYISANTWIGVSSIFNTTYGIDADYASLAFTGEDIESNGTCGVNADNAIQLNFEGVHFESNNATACILTGTVNTKGLKIRGGRSIGSITASVLNDPGTSVDSADTNAKPLIYGPGNLRSYATGTYITGEVSGAFATGTIALAANTLYAFPLMMNGTATWTTIAANVTTTGSALNLRLGIFNSGIDSLPSTLLVDGGTASANTLGAKQIAFSQILSPGLYYGVIVADGTVTVTGAAAGNASASNRWLEAVGVTAWGAADVQLSRAFAYGALSGATPFGAPTRAAAGMPVIGLKH